MDRRKLPYIFEINANGPRLVGPFDSDMDARDYGVILRDPRWHLVHLDPDDAHAPLSVLTPRYATKLQQGARRASMEMARAGVV